MQWDVKGDTTFGPFEPSPAPLEEVERLAEACTRAGLPATAVADARGPQWRKVIFNAATNPVGALTGLTHGRVCEDPALRRLVSGLVDEGKAVASAQGITLDADPEELIDHAARPEVAYDHKASMLQDVEARPADRDRLPERRHRALRARARRADAAERGDTRARAGTGAVVGVSPGEVERRYANVRAALEARRARRGARLRERVHRLRGRGHLPLGLPDRPPLRVRGAAASRASRRSSSRARPATSASTAPRGSRSRSSPTARATGWPTGCGASESASTGSTT